ncbi:efflux RND transporter periplasmic adaptor subunit [Altererythrobacter aerius]|uniref:Efflux RND transporter periplasmic adaptor subunit n=1 Tax=Tsuneonella aeria TaxID=1837929 RepID=A0A6I4TGV0_9SPHN|nr:efflux RND transporter periplasmic adaptor subunit [Tsuneonella aeria]MXO75305.1 efflux RND transporter periplasmic adaptor subunit [Tsuneonella aeria]
MNYETTVAADAAAPYSADGGDLTGVPGESRSPNRRRWAIGAIAAAIILVAAFFFMSGGEEADPFAPPEAGQVPIVSVTAPGRATVAGTIEATGTLFARRELPVGSVGEGGRVISVSADEGDWVRQGQVLVTIDRSVQVQQIEGARAQIGVAQADLNLAQSNLDRALKLVDRGFISKADVDRLTATRDAARARVAVARATVGELQARTARLNIYAPASGLVLTRSVEPGQTVGAGGTPLFTIAQGGEMELRALLSEENLAKIAVGSSATVTPVSSEKSFTGQVWQISPTIDQQNRQGEARIALSYAPELRPGGFASATLSSGTVVAPLLPESAIQNDDDGRFVYVVGNDDRVRRTPVKTGAVTARGVTILEGLTGSEQVVLRAGGFLADGDKVKPQRAR